jgi:hypothetical protein
LTPAADQGATIGVAQSAGSLARILGPLFAAGLYTHIPALPYMICGTISIGTGGLALQRLRYAHPADAGNPSTPDSPEPVKQSS